MKQATGILILVLLLIVGCTRQRPSEKPPIHLNPNMDDQPKLKAQGESRFFADGAAMRLPVEGTVSRGSLRADSIYYEGRHSDTTFVKVSPVTATAELLERGRERYDIFCSPCHGRTGDGRGMVVRRGMLPPPTFHQDTLRTVEDGYIFSVISNGIRNMPPYKYQISVEDRWAIVAYFRALQLSRNARQQDVPVEYR